MKNEIDSLLNKRFCRDLEEELESKTISHCTIKPDLIRIKFSDGSEFRVSADLHVTPNLYGGFSN